MQANLEDIGSHVDDLYTFGKYIPEESKKQFIELLQKIDIHLGLIDVNLGRTLSLDEVMTNLNKTIKSKRKEKKNEGK